jgi:hypothetical protein
LRRLFGDGEAVLGRFRVRLATPEVRAELSDATDGIVTKEASNSIASHRWEICKVLGVQFQDVGFEDLRFD